MTKGHPLKGCLFYFPNFAGYCPGSRYLANEKKIRGGTRSQLRRPLFPLGLPLVGHAEKHVVKGQEIDEWRYRWIFESRGNG